MSVLLFAELKRRRVFRAVVGYGVVAFALLQISEPVMHGLHWPESVLTYLVVALTLGFPLVAGLAWIFDVNAGGIERTAPAAPATALRGTRLALLLAGIGLLAAAPGLAWYFLLRARDGSTGEARRAPSIVVLPFVNLSGEKENEYFSDGVTEELINALANVEGVRVVARTSAFSFKGRSVDVRKIGEDLNVATVLEGSVRREGSQLRVFAQLIGVSDGYHLWSKSYDRELKNVFSLEDELARAIVQALVPKLVHGRALVQPTTASTEAHDIPAWRTATACSWTTARRARRTCCRRRRHMRSRPWSSTTRSPKPTLRSAPSASTITTGRPPSGSCSARSS